jgi:hypothetical protein
MRRQSASRGSTMRPSTFARLGPPLLLVAALASLPGKRSCSEREDWCTASSSLSVLHAPSSGGGASSDADGGSEMRSRPAARRSSVRRKAS